MLSCWTRPAQTHLVRVGRAERPPDSAQSNSIANGQGWRRRRRSRASIPEPVDAVMWTNKHALGSCSARRSCRFGTGAQARPRMQAPPESSDSHCTPSSMQAFVPVPARQQGSGVGKRRTNQSEGRGGALSGRDAASAGWHVPRGEGNRLRAWAASEVHQCNYDICKAQRESLAGISAFITRTSLAPVAARTQLPVRRLLCAGSRPTQPSPRV